MFYTLLNFFDRQKKNRLTDRQHLDIEALLTELKKSCTYNISISEGSSIREGFKIKKKNSGIFHCINVYVELTIFSIRSV